ncbi:MAG: phage tail tape measure protein [Armatimonadota bacterium]
MSTNTLTLQIRGESREAVEAMRRFTQGAGEMLGVSVKMGDALDAASKKATSALDRITARTERVEQGFQHLALGAAAALAPLAGATKTAMDFDAAMRSVDSILRTTPAEFDRLKQSVQEMSRDPRVTKGPTDLANGLYDIVSAGFEGQEALDILRRSAIGATAGLTETAVAADALTSVLASKRVYGSRSYS